ncbi:ABC-F family ATP-binding cassette domain-containing protein [Rhizobium sp. LjRoot30]|uniref:ABC-F family ATP-binding cassette domain-containing protein n=1 Tax=Rhizobium sp. LjRoot30 TaxID=3342320 RepID=UPI003ED114FF
MPASITLSDLTWSTPDGRPLFSHLDLSFGAERTGLVGRNGVGKSTILRLVTGVLQPQSGAISVEGRIGLLRQSVQVETDETIADLFEIAEPLAVLARAERGEASAEDLAVADWTLEVRLASALADVGLDAAADTRLAALSGGQRTRAALAALVFSEPDMLLLDEPTNNLDRSGRAAVIDLLSRWRGGALVVSHDRELLEMMDAIVELTSIGAKRYGGGWSQFQERRRIELSAAEHDLASAEKRLVELAQTTQQQVERQARRDGVGKRKAARGDMPRIIADGLKRRAEETGADKARLAERRRQQAMEDAAAARERIEILQPFSAQIGSVLLPPGKPVLRVDDVTVGYLPDQPILSGFSCSITGPERVAVSGPNGSGKTTLLALVTGALQPWSGSVTVGVPFALLDQTVSLLDPAVSIRDNFRRINPQADENACRAALARFMFRADAALQQVSTLSGGQLLRAGLACVLGGPRPPQLLVLDEPTNHLDIDSIGVVERGLRAYDGALLVVSHDAFFLEEIAISRRLQLGGPDC